ncbi:peptidyl-prolyl cis-trans isomerase C [Roseinatronobacter thiooxidans]|uniref:Parvulin-like PPIase n=1 Tax=Roseinatronobacter thiooxidans TaxID=121821 RepID=A0A2W7Q1E7_9RHOB|nr:peptidylprolyl isomerase [Roseinatronobacter thiooxidans]PZX42131.1 peptidyl-prolyl cis-trans isomerase C [Roseinatronobacter thiooxidans]
MAGISRFSVAVAAVMAFGAPVLAQSDPTRDTILATVNGTEITLGHLLAARDTLPEQFRQMPGEALFGPLVEQLIEQTAIMQQAEGTLTAREQIAFENEQRAFIANAALTRAAEAALSEENINEAYTAFVTEFDGREPTPEFNASHIIVETEAEAAALRAQLDDGADFADLAREHSMDGAAAGGGSLGWFGLGAMIPEFEQAVQSLEIGAYLGPLETQFGWHLVLLNDTRMSSAPALEEVREALAENLQREAAQAALASATEAASIERNYEGLDASILSRSDLLDD